MTEVLPAGTPIIDWVENAAYDKQGNLWISRLRRHQVERYDASGHLIGTVSVEYPGAIRQGQDGLLYVVYGNSQTSLLPGNSGGVVRFDPVLPKPVPQIFAAGLGQANGADFDSAGNLYVADAFSGVVRYRPDGTVDSEWTARAKIFGVDGIAVRGNDVYVTLPFSTTGRILRVPIDDPARHTVVADLSPSLIPDDGTVSTDSVLYVGTGVGLVAVDSVRQQSCTILTSEPLTSAAFVPGSDTELMVGTYRGALLRVHLPS
jgi:virginiamycin B lyase